MTTRLIITLLVIASLVSSCTIVEYEDYVHEQTQEARQAIIWQQRTMEKVSELTDEPVFLIPNLREFSTSFSQHKAKLILCSESEQQIIITKAILTNDHTGRKVQKTLEEKVVIDKKGYNKKNPLFTSIYLFQDEDMDYVGDFQNAESLTLEVFYRFDSTSPEKKKTYVIKLKKAKDIAWVT